MQPDPTKPGLLGLLRGEGEDPVLNGIAWLGLLLVVFLVSLAAFMAAP